MCTSLPVIYDNPVQEQYEPEIVSVCNFIPDGNAKAILGNEEGGLGILCIEYGKNTEDDCEKYTRGILL